MSVMFVRQVLWSISEKLLHIQSSDIFLRKKGLNWRSKFYDHGQLSRYKDFAMAVSLERASYCRLALFSYYLVIQAPRL